MCQPPLEPLYFDAPKLSITPTIHTIPKMLSHYLWRQRVKLETTLAFTVMEPWERVLVMFIYTGFTLFLAYAVYRFLPRNVPFMHQRVVYYLWGQDSNDLL